MKTTLTAKVHHLGESELMSLIPTDTITRIKLNDQKPVFRAYAIAHEGAAEGNIIGHGKRVMQYFRDAILRLHDRLRIGTPIFHRHNSDNSHENRKPVGELVGKALRDIGGTLYDIAVTYITPEFKDVPLDIASIEADVQFTDDGGGHCTAVDVGDITGIALSNSAVERPGFPGATLLATVQAFVRSGDKEDNAMTLEELREEAKKLKAKATDLFEPEELFKVAEIKDKIELTGREAARRVKIDDLEPLRESIKKLESERDGLKQAVFKSKATGVFETLSTERKLTPAQKAFAQRGIETFQTQAADDEGLKRDLNGFIDGRLKEFSAVAEILGVKVDAATDKGGTPSTDGSTPPGSDIDYTDPKNNPLIQIG